MNMRNVVRLDRDFLARHQNKLLYGTDCQDVDTQSEQCCGIRTLATIRRLAPDAAAVRKILSGNARRAFGKLGKIEFDQRQHFGSLIAAED